MINCITTKYKEKIYVANWMLAITIAFVFLCNSRHLGINYYMPIMLPAMLISFLSLFVQKIKLRVEHFCILILILLTVIHLNNSIEYLDDSKVIFSQTILLVFFMLFSLNKINIRGLKLLANSFIFCSVIFSFMIFIIPYDYGGGHYSIRTFIGTHNALDPNYLAACIAIATPILLKRVIYPQNKQYRLLYIILLIIILLGLLMTGSRSAVVAFVFGFFVLAIKDKKKIFIALIFMGILSIVMLYLLPQDIQDRLFYKSYIDGSNIRRVQLWETTIDKILEKPMIGYGPISTKMIVSGYNVTGATHNTFLMILLNFGLFGFVAFLIIYFKIFILCLNKDMYLFLAIFINLSFTSFIISNNISIFFWTTLVFLIMAGNYKMDHPEVTLWDKI